MKMPMSVLHAHHAFALYVGTCNIICTHTHTIHTLKIHTPPLKICNDFSMKAEEAPLPPALTVHHYHFTDWPDRGVPSSPSTLLHLLHHIHTTHPSLFTPSHNSLPTESPPPLLAHCSAGVGRTGTLLAVHRLLEQVKAGAKRVNILQTVRELRRWRPGMVQNLVRAT